MKVFFSIYFFIFGTLIGSFLNVLIHRLPSRKDIVFTRSACPKCGQQLSWYHNIPLLSYLVLKGKCAFCGTRINLRYPLLELFMGLIAYLLMPEVMNLTSLGFFIFHFAISSVFITHFIIDLEHHLLLDSLNLYLLAIVLPFSIFFHDWEYWVFGGAIGFGFPLLVTWLFYKIRGQVGLGGGDIKLFGILGIFLGPMGVILTIFLSCFIGALVGSLLIATKKLSRDRPMAFGPAIIIVAAFQIFFPQAFSHIQHWLL